MEMHWTFEGCDEQDEARIERHWEQVQIELAGKLAGLDDAAVELRMAVQHNESAPIWDIQAALHLPGSTLVAEGQAQKLETALDYILGGLSREIDNRNELPTDRFRRRKGTEDCVPFLDQCRTSGRSKAFISFLLPVIESLGPYVQRELRVLENEEKLIGEDLTAADVLDEVLVRAWDGFPKRNRELALDLWLIELADAVMRNGNGQLARESLDEEQPAPSAEVRSSERDEWIESASYPETIELSELLVGEPGVDVWDALDMDAKQAHLADMLSSLPRERRQAFVLSVAHGFEVAAIADFQSRPQRDVEEDIAEAIREVRRQFVDERAPDLQERFDRFEDRDRRRQY